jgi:hypothetical protein
MVWAGHAYKILIGIPEGKSPGCRGENFKMDAEDTGCEHVLLDQNSEELRINNNINISLRQEKQIRL